MASPEDYWWPASDRTSLPLEEGATDTREPGFEGTSPIPERLEPEEHRVVGILDADGILQFAVPDDAEATTQAEPNNNDAERVVPVARPSSEASEVEAPARPATSGVHVVGEEEPSLSTSRANSIASVPAPQDRRSRSPSVTHGASSHREDAPVAGPSRIALSRSPKLDRTSLSMSQTPITPGPQRIVLSQPSPVVAYMREKDNKPAKVMPIEQLVYKNRAFVVLPISRKCRDRLIARGVYDPRHDDWEPPNQQFKGLKGKYLQDAQIRGARGGARARPPEPIPNRFMHRPGPALLEPWASVLTEDSLLNRLGEYPCGWKGCDAILNSENHLAKHVRVRGHAMEGVFTVGSWGQVVLYRCKWRDCDEPCFHSIDNLLQHMTAVHISKVLHCPYGNCSLRSHNVSHLQRHVMKQHDEITDEPRARVDRPWRPPLKELPPLPNVVRTDELVTLPVRPSIVRTAQRAEWVRNKVGKECFAGPDPEIHIIHPPHMLELLESGNASSASGTVTPVDASVKEENKSIAKRRKRRAAFGLKPKYVAKKSKLSNVVNASPSIEPHKRPPVSRVYVEIPYTRPHRRPGAPLVYFDEPDVDDVEMEGTEGDDEMEGEGVMSIAIKIEGTETPDAAAEDASDEREVREELEEEEEIEEIEEFEDEDEAPTGVDDVPSPPVLSPSKLGPDFAEPATTNHDSLPEVSERHSSADAEDFHSVSSGPP